MKLRTIVLVLALLSVVSTSTGGYLYYRFAKEAAIQDAEERLVTKAEVLKAHVERLISRVQVQAKILSQFEELKKALLDQNHESLLHANRILDHFAAADVDVCYLMNTTGTCIVSSNRSRPDSFVGSNYSFRTYFTQAMNGMPSVSLAEGVTSGKREIYSSSPIYYQDEKVPVGVAVVKADIEALQREIYPGDRGIALLVDRSGMIFASSQRQWLLHLLSPVSQEQEAQIASTRQFGSGPWPYIGLEKRPENKAVDGVGNEYLMQELSLGIVPGWRIVYLESLGALSTRLTSPLVESSRYVALILAFLVTCAASVLYGMAHRDILLRRKAEEGLQESEERFRDVFENAFDASYIHDLAGNYVSANASVEKVLGWSREKFLNLNFRDIVYPEDLARTEEDFRKKVENGVEKTGPCEIRVCSEDGSIRWVEVTSRIVRKSGHPVAVQGSAREITDPKRAEEALRRGEEKFREVVELLPQPVFEIDERGRVTFASSKALEYFGYNQQDLETGLNAVDMIAPHERPLVQANIERVLGGEVLGGTEYTALRKDGTTFPALIHTVPILREHRAVGLRGIIADFTKQKQAELALRESEERFRTAFQMSPDAMTINLLRTGSYVDVNEGFCALSGYTREEALGKTARELGCWADPNVLRRIAAELQARGGIENTETKFRLKDGRVRTGLVSARVVDLQGEAHVLSIVRDVEELKQAQEGVARSERLFRTYFELGLVGMALASPQKGWVYVNDRLCDMLGYTREELLQTAWPELTHPDDLSADLEQFEGLLRGEINGYALDKRFVRKDGSIIYTTFHVSCIRDTAGMVEHVIAHIHDITDRKRLEEQLLQAAKMEALGRLAGGVAHDFNNLLTAMMGYADLLRQQTTPESFQHDKLLQISRTAERAASLTRQLLAFSRKQVLDMRVLDVSQVISGLEDMMKRLIGEDIELIVDSSPTLGHVRADPGQIEQILLNLVVNSRDAMPAGGQVTIETQDVVLDDEYARIRTEVTSGPYVMVAVSDSGHGMEAGILKKIFDPFFTTKEKGVGTGLGLATVYGIVKQHRGHVAVYSEVGKGTSFKIYLPRVDEAPEETPLQAIADEIPGGGETIMVVEDETVVRDLTVEALEMLGYVTLSAKDPSEAQEISRARGGPIHLLVTDLVLPKMDGRSLFENLSQLRPEMKVLYVSGYTENFIVHHGILDQGVHFLPKPFTLDGLARKVRQVLDELSDL